MTPRPYYPTTKYGPNPIRNRAPSRPLPAAAGRRGAVPCDGRHRRERRSLPRRAKDGTTYVYYISHQPRRVIKASASDWRDARASMLASSSDSETEAQWEDRIPRGGSLSSRCLIPGRRRHPRVQHGRRRHPVELQPRRWPPAHDFVHPVGLDQARTPRQTSPRSRVARGSYAWFEFDADRDAAPARDHGRRP